MSNVIIFADDGSVFRPVASTTDGHLKVNLEGADVVISTTSIINENNYDLDLTGPTLYADSSPIFVENPQGDNGWYYQSVNSSSQSNVYFYGNNALFQQSDIIYNKVECIFSVVDLGFVGTISNNLPILVIGTKPTGTNDHIPNFAHSVQTYSIQPTETLILNEKVVLYAPIGDYINYNLPSDLYSGLRRIKCELSSSYGTDFTTLPIAYISINTQTLSQSVRYTLHNAGFSFLKNSVDNVSNWNFVNSRARKAETNLSKLQLTPTTNLLKVESNLISGFATEATLDEIRDQTTKLQFTPTTNYLKVNNENNISGFSLETTQTGIKNQTDKLQFTPTTNYLKVSTQGIVDIDVDKITIAGNNNLVGEKGIVGASGIYAYNEAGTVMRPLTFSNSSYVSNEANKNRLDVSTVLIDPVNNSASTIVDINAVLLNGTKGLVCNSVLMGTKENNQSSRLLMNDDGILKVESNLISGFATEATLDEIRDQTTKLQFTPTTNYLKVNNENNISGFSLETTQTGIKNQTDKLQFTPTTNLLKVESNLISGFATEATLDEIRDQTTKLQFTPTTNLLKVKVDEMPTISGSVSITGTANVSVGNGITNPVIIGGYDGTNIQEIKTNIAGNLDIVGSVSVSNESIDTHCYGSSNGTTWHHLKTDTNGILNTHSRTEDGAGNDITSTTQGSQRGLDVNIINQSPSADTVKIQDSDGNALSAVSNLVPQLKTTLYNSAGAEFGTVAKPIVIGGSNLSNTYAIQTNTNGDLRSAVCDGAGTPITSNVAEGFPDRRGLDVILLNKARITDSGGNTINALTSPSNVVGGLKVQNVGSTNNANIADINATYAGTSYVSQANFITNGYTAPVCMGGWSGSGTSHNVVKVSASNALLTGLSTDANTIKIASTDNTIQFSQTSNQNNIKITDAEGDIATVSTPTTTTTPSTIRGLDTQSYLNAYNFLTDLYGNLTSTLSSPATPSGSYNALDVYARNPSTQVVNYGQTSVNGLSGLNMYQIYPKKIHYTLSGRTESGASNVIMGGAGSSKLIYDVAFGKASPQTFSAVITAGTGFPKTIRYEYVNSDGVLKTDGSISISAVNTVVNLTPSSIISVNKHWIAGTVGSTDQVVIRFGTTNTVANTICHSDVDDYNNGVITVPNGYIGYLTNIGPFSPTACFFGVIKWDENSYRSVSYPFYNQSNTDISSGYNGSLGGIYTAGESIAFSRITAMGASIAVGMFVLEPI